MNTCQICYQRGTPLNPLFSVPSAVTGTDDRKIVCSQCGSICPICGAILNAEVKHVHTFEEQPDYD